MTKSKLEKSPTCPCGSGQLFAQCCEPYLSGATKAPDAQALMRSRYTAYTLGNEEYLQSSWHPSTKPMVVLDKELSTKSQWLGLQVLAHHEQESQQDHPSATVEFIAKYKINGRAEKLHEISQFVFENGQWLYVSGVLKAI